MTSETHTKGPWVLRRSDPQEGVDCWHVETPEGAFIADVPGWVTMQNEVGYKNAENIARLIAAAPKLKAALKETHIMISELIHDVGEGEEVTLQQLADLQMVSREALKDISDD